MRVVDDGPNRGHHLPYPCFRTGVGIEFGPEVANDLGRDISDECFPDQLNDRNQIFGGFLAGVVVKHGPSESQLFFLVFRPNKETTLLPVFFGAAPFPRPFF